MTTTLATNSIPGMTGEQRLDLQLRSIVKGHARTVVQSHTRSRTVWSGHAKKERSSPTRTFKRTMLFRRLRPVMMRKGIVGMVTMLRSTNEFTTSMRRLKQRGKSCGRKKSTTKRRPTWQQCEKSRRQGKQRRKLMQILVRVKMRTPMKTNTLMLLTQLDKNWMPKPE